MNVQIIMGGRIHPSSLPNNQRNIKIIVFYCKGHEIYTLRSHLFAVCGTVPTGRMGHFCHAHSPQSDEAKFYCNKMIKKYLENLEIIFGWIIIQKGHILQGFHSE